MLRGMGVSPMHFPKARARRPRHEEIRAPHDSLGVRLNLEAPALNTSIPLHAPLSLASIEAVGNFERNLAAIALTQPRIAEIATAISIDMEWLFGRDGSLTARDPLGKWWSGCSLPRRAAQAVLKPMDASGRVACFLSPVHAAQVRVALRTLGSHQALIALGTDEIALRVMLHCEDFSEAIAGHRLWLAWGRNWTQELDRLFDEYPGLAVPAQFIRATGADTSSADNLIPIAQPIFHTVSDRRADSIRLLREGWHPSADVRKVCVIAPSHFRLWDDSGTALAHALRDAEGLEIFKFDSDDPQSASSLALAAAASECDAIVAPGITRADLPDVIAREMPWVTWVVTPRIPQFAAAGPADALLLADSNWRKSALAAGWPAHRVEIGGWPTINESPSDESTQPGPQQHVALIADTRPIEIPKVVEDYSSHRLLWEFLQAELGNDPLRVNSGIDAYINDGMRHLQIAEQGFERRIFVALLIVPAYQQGLARTMIAAGLPLRLWGTGWERIEEFKAFAGGPVGSRAALVRIAREAAAMIHPLPGGCAHSMDSLGRPVLRPQESQKKFIALCRKALQGEKLSDVSISDVITGARIAELIRRTRGG